MSPAARGLVVVVLLALMASSPASGCGDDVERVALQTLLQSDAADHEKAVACKRLAVIGTKESVPVLVSLLDDEKLSHYARFGLEAIPDPSVDEALRNALPTLEGLHRIGVINSIGNRRDVQAVDALAALLSEDDLQVAAAAAGALGRIANERSIRTLLQGLQTSPPPLRAAIADACLSAADRLRADDNPAAAAAVYQAVRSAEVPAFLRIAATLSAVQIPGPSSTELLKELLQSNDGRMFAVALQASRVLKDAAISQLILDQMDRQPVERKALLMTALADRSDATAHGAVREGAQSQEEVVQLAAINGLARKGDSSDVEMLMALTVGPAGPVSDAARNALEQMPGEDVDAAILSHPDEQDLQRFELLIQLAGNRRIGSAVPLILKAVQSENESLRVAAIGALGETVGSDQLDILARKVLSPRSPTEEAAAKAALISACVRMPDREACARQVDVLFAEGPTDRRVWRFELLRELGGEAALQAVLAGARDADDAVQDAATQTLGNWLTEDVAPPLLELAQSPISRKYQVRALRGYIRVIRQFGLPVEQRTAMARKALDASERDEEKQLVLAALTRFPSPEALSLAVELMDTTSLKTPAAHVALSTADRLKESHPDAARTALQSIIDAQVDEQTTTRANAILKVME
ncbi:MAG: HEAT repeat domain-containing protein, partial [Planctomycetaceae bacterium]|nr:HEAT repeat domain-containing protein [Planctomycetaceae bacterium]